MIRPKPSPRRPLTVAVAALAGLAAAFAVQAPALATNPSPASSVSAEPTASATAQPTATASPEAPTCVSTADARYTHTFDGPKGMASITLTNGPLCAGQEQALTLVSYVAPSATFAVPQYVLDKSTQKFTGTAEGELGLATLDFKVEVPECYTQIDFVFGSEVIDPLTDKSDRYGDRKVGSSKGIGSQSKGSAAWYNGGAGTCEATPEVIAESDCDGTVELTLVNRNGNAAATFEVTGSGGFTKSVEVPMRKLETLKLTAEQAKEISVSAKGMETFTGGWEQPEDCQEPAGTYDSTCDQMIFKVVNPEDGISLTSTFTPSTGAAKTVTIAPGKTETIAFAASKGFSVTVTGDLDSGGALAWEQPEGCDKGGAGGGNEDEPTLPLTGAAAGGIAAGAVALLALGAVLFVIARRRRVRFTA
ncbi:cell wall anchor protein [Micromonospora sp. GCM10011542]|uniref:cell wall anchor protein n=1 Tax=Micromonospora sp. GCM10011542 TaxID=3317337 RepID=UPI00360883A3